MLNEKAIESTVFFNGANVYERELFQAYGKFLRREPFLFKGNFVYVLSFSIVEKEGKMYLLSNDNKILEITSVTGSNSTSVVSKFAENHKLSTLKVSIVSIEAPHELTICFSDPCVPLEPWHNLLYIEGFERQQYVVMLIVIKAIKNSEASIAELVDGFEKHIASIQPHLEYDKKLIIEYKYKLENVQSEAKRERYEDSIASSEARVKSYQDEINFFKFMKSNLENEQLTKEDKIEIFESKMEPEKLKMEAQINHFGLGSVYNFKA